MPAQTIGICEQCGRPWTVPGLRPRNSRPCACGGLIVFPPPKGKYGNRFTRVDGQKFDSKKEAGRWLELKLLERAGKIKDLQRQVKYDLAVNGCLVCTYAADFQYQDCSTKEVVVEDVKSVATQRNPVYRLKRKLMRACHNITIREV